MSKPFSRTVYGTWDDCMKVVRKAKMHLKTPSKRLYDRYDITEIDGNYKELVIASTHNVEKPVNKKMFKLKLPATAIMTKIIGLTRLSKDDDIFCLTLYKD